MSKHTDPLGVRRVVWGALAWVVLLLAWWLVLHRNPRSWALELAVPLLSLVVVTAITLFWVRHNLGIYQRKGPRRGLPEVEAPWTADSVGRRLHLADGVLEARVVRVDVDGDVKRYEVAS